jgi:hypothetical protein
MGNIDRLFHVLVVMSATACGNGGDSRREPPVDASVPEADADPNAPDADPTLPDADPTLPDAAELSPCFCDQPTCCDTSVQPPVVADGFECCWGTTCPP